MATKEQTARKLIEYISTQRDKLQSEVRRFQARLTRELIKELSGKVTLTDGALKATFNNLRLTETMDRVWNDFVKSDYGNIITGYADTVKKIGGSNRAYFLLLNKEGKILKEKMFATAYKNAEAKMLYKIGIGADGNFVKNGFLDRLVADQSVIGQAKDYMMKSVTSQQDFKKTVDGLSELLEGVNGNNGAVDRYFNQYVYDTYSEYDNSFANELAIQLDLQCFIYEGGVVKDTREFCLEHESNVYTRDEAALWPEWKSPTTGETPSYIASLPGYDPLVDLGGFNCRHKLLWISNEEAIERRPELAEILQAPELPQAIQR